jgi:multiple sugar transport system permease protein
MSVEATTQVRIAAADRPATATRIVGQRPKPIGRILAYVVLIGASLGCLSPILWAAFTSLRPVGETLEKGYFSWPDTLTFDNYRQAWSQADFAHYWWNTLVITVPAVLVVLLLSTFLAYAVTRYSMRFNLALLLVFTAGNLLPPQVIITPLYRMYIEMQLPYWMADNGLWINTRFGVAMIHIAFQMGFCAFVMSSYMKTIPTDLTEAALIDGAGVWRQFWHVILPLCRAPLAALGTLEFTWIYNDFFWAFVLLIGRGDLQPITTALKSFDGVYFTNDNLVAAGSLIAAVPTILVFAILQRQFVGGLTLGASKG